MKIYNTTWITLVTYTLIIWEYTIVESAPVGMMAFFKLSECPEGWEVSSNTQGRLIHSVTNLSHINLTLGNPLPELTIPTHSHSVSSNIYIPSKGISTNVNPNTFASSGTAYYTLDFPDALPNYPFVHLLLCRLVNDTVEGVPKGVIAFFDNDTCPPRWTPYSESVGRIIIPGSSENGVVFSAAAPLASQEDRLHTHTYTGSFTTATRPFWRYFINNWSPANPGTYQFTGTTFEASSGLPYIQLLTCRSIEDGTGLDLPLGIHLFFSNGYCSELPENLWQEADSNVTGHWIISLPENGTVGTSFGGNPWAVTATAGRYGTAHHHPFNGSIALPTFTMAVGDGPTTYVPSGTYSLSGISDGGDLGIPYLSMPMCVLGNTSSPPTPSPSPGVSPSPAMSSDSDSDSGSKMTAMWIGIIVGIGGFLMISTVLVALLLLKMRSNRQHQWQNADKQSEQYTISISMGSIQTDSSIAISNIEIKEKLGGGNFGEVFKGIWNGTTPVALKKLKSREQLQEFAQEAKVLLSLNHPNIVRCLGIHTSSSGDQYIVMEYLSSGSLDNVLRREPNLQIGDLLIMAKHAAAGMLYLEQQHFVHRDLALRNLLVAFESASYTVKVSDFGLSRKIQEEGYYMKLDTQGIPIRWTAPEVFEKGLYTTKSDVWSFGITLWELFSFGQIPYADMTNFEVMQKVPAGYRLRCPNDCPEAIYTLMLQCWQQNPETRPGFKDIYDVIETVSKNYNHQSLQWAQNVQPPNNNNNYNSEDAQENYN
eukprot:CAMPEP_0168555594 /NCGR_PEP_ID=MMETSP0413-20121227/8422_1 /TAXON_ID=136452 /ORGANISM="Filamoeba nolandi, Strain NC-AS-23-1" /LENGTH=763 /DNA_ID=CAMNT_0008586463 /DNA_START=44 /DNA_END=2335 /DNA_ORIENTATION=-